MPRRQDKSGFPFPRSNQSCIGFAATFACWYVKKDWKSTRLNSSHSQISYAVFCLKKKKTYLRFHNSLSVWIINKHACSLRIQIPQRSEMAKRAQKHSFPAVRTKRLYLS